MYEINLNSIDFDIGLLDVASLDYLNETHEKILYEFLIGISEGKQDTWIPRYKLPLIIDFLKNNATNILHSYLGDVEPALKNEEGELFIDDIKSDNNKLLRIKFSIFFDSKKALLSDKKIREMSENFILDAIHFCNNYNLSSPTANRIKNNKYINNVIVDHKNKKFIVKKELRLNINDIQKAIKDIQEHFGSMKLFRVKLNSHNVLTFTAHKKFKIEE